MGSGRSPQTTKTQKTHTSPKYTPQESFFDTTDKEIRAKQEAKKKAAAEAEKLAAGKSHPPENTLESAKKAAEQYRQYATKMETSITEHPEWSKEKAQGVQEIIGLLKAMAEQQDKIIQGKQKGDTAAVDAAKEKHKELETQCKEISGKIRDVKPANTEEKSPEKGGTQQ